MESRKRRRFSQLAKKTEIMAPVVLTYRIKFSTFDLEIRVDILASLQTTSTFDSVANVDKYFAVGELWVVSKERTARLAGSLNLGNAFETLRDIRDKGAKAVSLDQLPVFIQPGELGRWLFGYRDRLKADLTTEIDEERYEMVYRYCVVDDENSFLFIFPYRNDVYVEATTLDIEAQTVATNCCAFDSGVLKSEIDRLLIRMDADLRNGLGLLESTS